MEIAPEPMELPAKQKLVQRHSAAVRLTHWINVVSLTFLLASGLQIFNAHPRSYLGKYGADNDAAVLEIAGTRTGDTLRGTLRIGRLSAPTTGFLGASKEDGAVVARAFPAWLTLPSYHDLGAGRRWHFTFAWLLLIMIATGLAMSPAVNAALPLLLDLLGGRATARTLHFVTAFSIVAFVVVHVAMVIASGLWNNLRSMMTGRYAIQIDGGVN